MKLDYMMAVPILQVMLWNWLSRLGFVGFWG